MRLFLIPSFYRGGNFLELRDKDYHYLIRVLRYKKGFKFPGRDGQGLLYELTITDITDECCILDVKYSEKGSNDLPEIVLYQCLCKGKKMDQIVRQATESGVSKIIPVVSDYAVTKLNRGNSGKFDRWNKIIREAVQQSGSLVNTYIDDPVTIEELEIPDNKMDRGLFFHQEALDTASLHGYLSSNLDKIYIVIGPEGGLSEREIVVLREKEYKPVYLKTNILRSETAAIYALSSVQTIVLERENWMLKE
jgi:16S rRNA (uracil1498-N3)-methyltransferase